MAGENSDGIFGALAPRWGGDPTSHSNRHRTDGQGLTNWESNNAWDIHAPKGTAVYAIVPGTVDRVKASKITPERPTIYGDQISVSGSSGYPTVYYTHIQSAVGGGQDLKVGDLIGYIIQHPTNPNMPTHVHVGLSGGADIKKYVATNGYLLLQKPGAKEGETLNTQTEGGEGKDSSDNSWAGFLASIGIAITDPIGTIKNTFENWLRGLYLEVHNLQTLRDNFQNNFIIPDDVEGPVLEIIDKIIIEAGGVPKTETGTPVSQAGTEEEEEEEVEKEAIKQPKEINKYSYKSRPPFGRSNKKWEW